MSQWLQGLLLRIFTSMYMYLIDSNMVHWSQNRISPGIMLQIQIILRDNPLLLTKPNLHFPNPYPELLLP